MLATDSGTESSCRIFSPPLLLEQLTDAADAELIGNCFQAPRDLFVQLESLYLFNVPQGVFIMISVLIKSISGH